MTAIKEANDLTTLDITTLFGKLEEHQQELASLEKYEKKIKKDKTKDKESENKSIALVASSSMSQIKSIVIVTKTRLMRKWNCLFGGTTNSFEGME